jgi:hypothetical protein
MAWSSALNTFLRISTLLVILLASNACTNLTSLLFYPHTGYYQTPKSLELDYQTISIETDTGERLQSWLINPKQKGTSAQRPAKAYILYLHGNGENISTHINSVAWLSLQGYGIFLLDYRGYGLSQGHSTLSTAVEDIGLAHQWLSDNTREPLIILGQSMGGALAITYTDLSSPTLRPFLALISESAPASWPQIAREVMQRHWITWLLQAPASLMTSQYDAEDHIASLNLPMLLIHSKEDPIVPYHHLQQLIEAYEYNDKKVALAMPVSGGHTQAFAKPENRDALLDFLDKVLKD